VKKPFCEVRVGRKAYRDCLGAVRARAPHPEVQGLASLHHNAWRQRVATRVNDSLLKVVLHITQLRNLRLFTSPLTWWIVGAYCSFEDSSVRSRTPCHTPLPSRAQRFKRLEMTTGSTDCAATGCQSKRAKEPLVALWGAFSRMKAMLTQNRCLLRHSGDYGLMLW
jgi:hypothetical protein